jgi:2-oxoglutarate ferredoxin oxidoreductase subunit delta
LKRPPIGWRSPREITLSQLQVSSAHGTGRRIQDELVRGGLGIGEPDKLAAATHSPELRREAGVRAPRRPYRSPIARRAAERPGQSDPFGTRGAGDARLAFDLEVPMAIAVQPTKPGERGPDAFMPLEIAVDRCKGCGLCVAACPKGILELDVAIVNALGYHPVRLVDRAACTSCVLCARVCPDAVFSVFARPKVI